MSVMENSKSLLESCVCPYKVLQVCPKASCEEIRAQYLQLCKRYHPDKNGNCPSAANIFKQICEAYQIVTDKAKRDIYDHFGYAGLKGEITGDAVASWIAGKSKPSPAVPSNNNDDWRSLFEAFGHPPVPKGKERRQHSRDGSQSPRPSDGSSHTSLGKRKKPAPSTHDLNLTLEELYNGCTKRMKVTRARYPGGMNSAPVKDSKILTIPVKPGWKKGTRVTFESEGDHHCPREDPADVVFVVNEKPHSFYTRIGRDLHCRVRVSLTESLCGVVRTIKSLDGRDLVIDTKGRCAKPEGTFIIPHEGMPMGNGEKGVLVVVFDVDYPDSLTTEQKKVVMDVLTEPMASADPFVTNANGQQDADSAAGVGI